MSLSNYFGLEEAELIAVTDEQETVTKEDVLEAEIAEAELEEVIADVEQLEDVQEGLESVAAVLANMEGELTPEVAQMAQIATENAMRSLGELSTRVFVGLENVDTFRTAELGNEAIGDVIGKVKGAAQAAAAKITEAALKVLDKVITSSAGLKRDVGRYRAQLGKLADTTEVETLGQKNLKRLHLDGATDAASIITGLKNTAEAVTIINGPYLKAIEEQTKAIYDAIGKKKALFSKVAETEGAESDEELIKEGIAAFEDIAKILEGKVVEPKGLKDLPISGGKQIGEFKSGKDVFDNSKVKVANKGDVEVPSKAQIEEVLKAVETIVDSISKNNVAKSTAFNNDQAKALKEENATRLRSFINSCIHGFKATVSAPGAAALAALAFGASGFTALVLAVLAGAAFASYVVNQLLSLHWLYRTIKGGAKGEALEFAKGSKDVRKAIVQVNKHGFNVAVAGLGYASQAMKAYDAKVEVYEAAEVGGDD